MAKTGQKFDINPETFTLQNVFAMELHRFQETIAEIVTCATKELGIEKVFMRFYVQIKEHICFFQEKNKIFNSSFIQGVKEVEDTWGNMKFNVQKYTKGTSDRGFILGAIDEVLQILDDNAMNLQSMSASRFIGPFFNTVQNWEKSLSHVSEVLDVSIYFDSKTSLCSYPKFL